MEDSRPGDPPSLGVGVAGKRCVHIRVNPTAGAKLTLTADNERTSRSQVRGRGWREAELSVGVLQGQRDALPGSTRCRSLIGRTTDWPDGGTAPALRGFTGVC